MKTSSKLAVAALMLGSASISQATTYDVSATFLEPTALNDTMFNGTFDLVGGVVSNFMGTMNEAMFNSTAVGTSPFMGGNMMMNTFPIMSLGGSNGTSIITYGAGNMVTISAFKENSTDVFYGGGYDLSTPTSSQLRLGSVVTVPNVGSFPDPSGLTWNKNAFFTMTFDTSTLMGDVNDMFYGDCNTGGLMSPMMTGDLCMTGKHIIDPEDGKVIAGSMGASGSLLSIAAVSAVPVPAAAWLFGGALVSLFGANRRKNVLPA